VEGRGWWVVCGKDMTGCCILIAVWAWVLVEALCCCRSLPALPAAGIESKSEVQILCSHMALQTSA